MAIDRTDSSSWADKFHNILTLEETRGFDNKAVVGGLDKFVARFSERMAAQDISDREFMLQEPYGSMSTKLRAQWVTQWREALSELPHPKQKPRHNTLSTRAPKSAVVPPTSTTSPSLTPPRAAAPLIELVGPDAKVRTGYLTASSTWRSVPLFCVRNKRVWDPKPSWSIADAKAEITDWASFNKHAFRPAAYSLSNSPSCHSR